MSAINFVVRNAAGNLQRGMVAGEGAENAVVVSGGNDISLNLDRSQIASYAQDGQALLITLTDGRVIVVQGYFAADGSEQSDLYISSDGLLTAVNLTPGNAGQYYANYIEQDVFGKWSPDDGLYFSGERIEAAVIAPADDAVGMLGLPFLAGLGPIGALIGAGLGAVVLGSTETDPDPVVPPGPPGPPVPPVPPGPTVAILEGTLDAGHVVNATDHADGVDISGTGTVGGTVHVEIGDAWQEVVVGADGTWTVTFPPADIDTGTYEIDVEVTITLGDLSLTIDDVLVVDTETMVTFAEDAVGGNGTVNAGEAAGGTVLTGSTEAGSTVTVIMGSHTYTAVVTGTTWSVNVPPADLAGGEYVQPVTVNAVDQYGNTATTTGDFIVDTLTHVTLVTATVGGDGTVNGTEQTAGITVTGTAQAGASVVVTFAGVSHTVIATAAGTWSSSYAASEVAAGTYDATVTAVATDQAGNTASASGSVHVDTQTMVTVNTATVETDGIVNLAEHSDGITLTGTAEAGASVSVTMAGFTRSVTALANGTWSANFAAGEVPTGETTAPVTVTATDAAGNSASASGTVQIDTIVNRLTIAGPVEGDDLVNRAEALDGIRLNGTVEAGSVVNVTFEGITRAATVDAAGNWTVNFTGDEVPPGEYTTTVTVAATDHVGNTRSLTDTFAVDTTPPEAPLIESYTRGNSGVRGLSTSITDDMIEIAQVSGSGQVAQVPFTTSQNVQFDEMNFTFSAPIPNGSHLVMTARDDSGNNTSTLFMLEETNTNVVNIGNAGLDRFQIEAIDLQFAEDSVLTLSVADLESLSAHSNSLTIHGGADDTVNIAGATTAGLTTDIGGRTYDIYSLGTHGGTLMIDESITVVT